MRNGRSHQEKAIGYQINQSRFISKAIALQRYLLYISTIGKCRLLASRSLTRTLKELVKRLGLTVKPSRTAGLRTRGLRYPD